MVIANDVINLQDQPGAVSQLAKLENLPKSLFQKFGSGLQDFLTSQQGQGTLTFLSLLPGPLGKFARNVGVPLALTANQKAAQDKTDAQREAIFEQAEGEVTSNRINIQNLLANLSGDVQGRLTADKNRLTGLLEGLGETERGDINRQFTEFSADETSRLQERGLGSTSVVSGVRGGIEERRTRSLAGLKERLRNARLGIESSFSQQSTSAAERLGLAGINFQDKNTADLVNLLASKQIIGPDQNSFFSFSQGLGGSGVEKADLPGTNFAAIGAEVLAAYLTGGASLALTQGGSVTGQGPIS